jgi:hypothetical protein
MTFGKRAADDGDERAVRQIMIRKLASGEDGDVGTLLSIATSSIRGKFAGPDARQEDRPTWASSTPRAPPIIANRSASTAS